MNSKHLWSVIIASEDSYDSHDQWSHMIAMNTDCEQSLFIGTAMNLDSERSMIKHIIHDEVGSMLWNAGVHTWSTLILYHIMTPKQYIYGLLWHIQGVLDGLSEEKGSKFMTAPGALELGLRLSRGPTWFTKPTYIFVESLGEEGASRAKEGEDWAGLAGENRREPLVSGQSLRA